MVKPALVVAVLFRTLDTMRMFDLPAAMIGFGKYYVETVSTLAYVENNNLRYGAAAAEATPPVKRMLEKGVNVSAGTDATRVASYNPWVSLSWLITGKTVGGLQLTPQRNCLSRDQALRMWTENVTWFSNEQGRKGCIQVGQLADLIVPDRDFFACPESDIADTSALLTVVGGKVVYGVGDFARFDDAAPPPAMPDWSPVRRYGGFAAWGDPEGAGKNSLNPARYRQMAAACGCGTSCGMHGHQHASAWASSVPASDLKGFFGALGDAIVTGPTLTGALPGPEIGRAHV